jgi:predicted amidohydrolase YtcJ
VTLFTNADVFTGRSASDRASAFRVEEGVVTWVGDAASVAGEESTDLGGRVVLPGLLDLHTHPAVMASRGDAIDVLPPAVTSIAALVEKLRQHPALGAGPGAWITGNGYDDSIYPEGRAPNRHDLDLVSTEQPILIWRCDSHSAAVNTRALELAGITADTPDPYGAHFERDADGIPTGQLVEHNAVTAVSSHIPTPDAAEYSRILAAYDEHFLSHGLTGVCDLLSSYVPDHLATFRAARELGLRTRVNLYPGWTPELPDLSPGDTEGPVRIAGCKVLVDGAFSNRTAWVAEPYPDSHDHGIPALTDDELRGALGWARRNGVQLAVHAMGDAALHHVVDLLGDEEPWLEGIPSLRFEHATLVSAELIARLESTRLTFGIATHTIFLYAETAAYHDNLGPEQARIAYPVRSLLASSLPLALSSDRPATAWDDADDVFVSLEAAVRRVAHDGSDIGAAEAVPVSDALLLYTSRAAQLVRFDAKVGVLEPGAVGDFVVLDRDIFAVPADRIHEVRVAETWIAGEKVWTL